MKCSILCFGILVAMLTLTGCRKEDPNPELLDPIFMDLDKRASDSQKGLEDELKKQIDLKIALDKAEPNSLDLKNAQRDLDKSVHLALDLDQNARYYKIRSTRRRLVDRITYKQAFAANQPWPDPHEYSDYQVNIRLRNASRNWDARVPKLQNRVVSAHPKEEKAAKPEE